MRTLVAVAAVLLAGCSRDAYPAPEPAPKPAPERPADPIPAPKPEPEAPPTVDGRIFSVQPKADQSTGHDLIAFVGRLADLESLTEAHLAKETPKDLRPLQSTDDLNLYLLWGRRSDDLSKSGLEADRIKDKIRVTATWKYSHFGGMNDTGGVRYVGYGFRLGRLRSGQYAVEVHENSRDPQEGRRRTAQVTFEVLHGAGPADPPPPPKGGNDLPRLTCQSGCCVGMHTFKFATQCGECKKARIADGHKYCPSCAEKLRRCVHCGQAWK